MELIALHMSTRANPRPRAHTWKAAVLRVACKNATLVLALRREQEQMLVSQWGRSPIGQGRLWLLARLQLPAHEGCG